MAEFDIGRATRAIDGYTQERSRLFNSPRSIERDQRIKMLTQRIEALEEGKLAALKIEGERVKSYSQEALDEMFMGDIHRKTYVQPDIVQVGGEFVPKMPEGLEQIESERKALASKIPAKAETFTQPRIVQVGDMLVPEMPEYMKSTQRNLIGKEEEDWMQSEAARNSLRAKILATGAPLAQMATLNLADNAAGTLQWAKDKIAGKTESIYGEKTRKDYIEDVQDELSIARETHPGLSKAGMVTGLGAEVVSGGIATRALRSSVGAAKAAASPIIKKIAKKMGVKATKAAELVSKYSPGLYSSVVEPMKSSPENLLEMYKRFPKTSAWLGRKAPIALEAGLAQMGANDRAKISDFVTGATFGVLADSAFQTARGVKRQVKTAADDLRRARNIQLAKGIGISKADASAMEIKYGSKFDDIMDAWGNFYWKKGIQSQKRKDFMKIAESMKGNLPLELRSMMRTLDRKGIPTFNPAQLVSEIDSTIGAELRDSPAMRNQVNSYNTVIKQILKIKTTPTGQASLEDALKAKQKVNDLIIYRGKVAGIDTTSAKSAIDKLKGKIEETLKYAEKYTKKNELEKFRRYNKAMEASIILKAAGASTDVANVAGKLAGAMDTALLGTGTAIAIKQQDPTFITVGATVIGLKNFLNSKGRIYAARALSGAAVPMSVPSRAVKIMDAVSDDVYKTLKSAAGKNTALRTPLVTLGDALQNNVPFAVVHNQMYLEDSAYRQFINDFEEKTRNASKTEKASYLIGKIIRKTRDVGSGVREKAKEIIEKKKSFKLGNEEIPIEE